MKSIFVNKGSGSIVQITNVDSSYAYIEVMFPDRSKWAMPLLQYNTTFIKEYRPATAKDLEAIMKDSKNFILPENAPDDWK